MSTPTAYVLSLSCADRPGIVHAVSGLLAQHGGNIVESQQFGAEDTGNFFMRVSFTSTAAHDELTTALAELGPRFAMTWNLDLAGRAMRTLILVSKAEHCVNDLLFRERAGTLPIDVVSVVGNHGELSELAAFYGKPFVHIPVTPETKADAEAALLAIVEELGVELVVLARYMQILSPELSAKTQGPRDQHPPLVPALVQGRAPLPAGARSRRQAHRRHRALRHERPRRGPDHRAGR